MAIAKRANSVAPVDFLCGYFGSNTASSAESEPHRFAPRFQATGLMDNLGVGLLNG
jgi:hypothetical protein